MQLRCVLVWAAMATGSPSIARVLVLPKPLMLGGRLLVGDFCQRLPAAAITFYGARVSRCLPAVPGRSRIGGRVRTTAAHV